MRNSILAFVILILFYSCKEEKKSNSRVNVLPFYNEATFTPHWLTHEDATLDTFHQISAFKLVNQEGDTVTNETFKDKIYVVDFFFTICPGICPKLTANMKDLQTEFMSNNDILLLSHSVTPERDSVPVLKKYAEENGILSHKWHLVTGAQKDIYTLGRKDYFVEENLGLEKDIDEFLHTENFVLIDKGRYIRGIYNGLNKAAVRQLIEDIKTLERE